MSSPSVILHVFGRMQRGGAENRTLALMRRLDRDRWRFHFGVLSGLPGELDEEIRELGGEVHPMRLGPAFPRRLLSVLRESGATIVHSHVHYSSGLLVALARFGGVRTRIAHFRSTSDGRPDTARRRAQRWLLRRWIDRFATHILAVGEGVMAAAWSPEWRSDPRCRVIYNGLDVSSFEGPEDGDSIRRGLDIPPGATLFCHVGSLRRAKNHVRLIEIFHEVAAREPGSRLLCIGRLDERLAPEAKARAESLGIGHAVRFAGERADVPRLLLASDAMVYPSLREGLPGAVLEACAAGLPVLASDLPGVREIARHFPWVRTLPLEAPDRAWAEEALRLPGTGPRALDPEWRPTEAFRGTPFDLDASTTAIASLYAEAEAPAR